MGLMGKSGNSSGIWAKHPLIYGQLMNWGRDFKWFQSSTLELAISLVEAPANILDVKTTHREGVCPNFARNEKWRISFKENISVLFLIQKITSWMLDKWELTAWNTTHLSHYCRMNMIEWAMVDWYECLFKDLHGISPGQQKTTVVPVTTSCKPTIGFTFESAHSRGWKPQT